MADFRTGRIGRDNAIGNSKTWETLGVHHLSSSKTPFEAGSAAALILNNTIPLNIITCMYMYILYSIHDHHHLN